MTARTQARLARARHLQPGWYPPAWRRAAPRPGRGRGPKLLARAGGVRVVRTLPPTPRAPGPGGRNKKRRSSTLFSRCRRPNQTCTESWARRCTNRSRICRSRCSSPTPAARTSTKRSAPADGGPEERSGCGVVSPLDCPATARGRTLVFPTSRALDACPYLQSRASGDCSAACVPISIAGKTVGVMHATGPDNEPPTEADVRYLEITTRHASERIAMLRAFEKSETQARTDPLTGLWNRRSLENRVRDLQRDGIPYALAYGDLDHFKILNDTHGHEAGDQALRLFSACPARLHPTRRHRRPLRRRRVRHRLARLRHRHRHQRPRTRPRTTRTRPHHRTRPRLHGQLRPRLLDRRRHLRRSRRRRRPSTPHRQSRRPQPASVVAATPGGGGGGGGGEGGGGKRAAQERFGGLERRTAGARRKEDVVISHERCRSGTCSCQATTSVRAAETLPRSRHLGELRTCGLPGPSRHRRELR